MGSSPTAKNPRSSGRNSDKRRERSKVAARCRRGKESEIFGELGLCLPISDNTRSTLDKASIMRLSLCHLKLREIVEKDFLCSPVVENGDTDRKCDSFLTEALGGFVFVLSMDGDVIYLSGGVTTYLGLSEAELMKCSIFEFTHPEDHKEIKEALAVNKRDSDEQCHAVRSVSCRMKCTITSRGRSVHMRAATYKVINFRGRIFGNPKEASSRWFGGIAEVLPHPSDVDIPLNKQTFLSKHSLDFKFEHVDDSIKGFLGYDTEDLLGKSFFEFINFSKDEMSPLVKVFSSLHSKGQAITEIYRFLAKYGGWVWVRTVATILYANNGTVPTSIVCLHFIASGIENSEEILSSVQHPVKPDIGNVLCNSNGTKKVSHIEPTEKENEKTADKENKSQDIDVPLLNNPIASTRKVFTRKTEDMDKGFLIPFDNTMIESKEDQEDLTHLAPMAGDECVQLGPPMLDDLLETLDQAEIEYKFDGLIVDVDADELPPLCGAPSALIRIVSCAEAENDRDLLTGTTANSPLFLNSDPHMTLSPDSKSLLSPFQNSNIPHECESICDLNSYNSTFTGDSKSCHSQLSVPTAPEKSNNFFHKDTSDIVSFDMSSSPEDAWNCCPPLHISDKISPCSPYFHGLLDCKISPIDSSPLSFKMQSEMFGKTPNEKLPTTMRSVGLFVDSMEENKISSPSTCSNTGTGLNHANTSDASLGCLMQHGYTIDSTWKTSFEIGDKEKHCKIKKLGIGSESEYSMNPVHAKSRFIPPEVSRKKEHGDYPISLGLANTIAGYGHGSLSNVTKDIFMDGAVVEAITINGARIEAAITDSHKRRKLVDHAKDMHKTTDHSEKQLKPNGQLDYCTEEFQNSKTKRKRNILGRLLCCSSAEGKLSLCELTRQDYEVNAPLGDNCCLLQGPDILNALEVENFPDSIL